MGQFFDRFAAAAFFFLILPLLLGQHLGIDHLFTQNFISLRRLGDLILALSIDRLARVVAGEGTKGPYHFA